MLLEPLIRSAAQRGASDLHLEPGLSPAVRICGRLTSAGEPLAPATLRAAAQEILGPRDWSAFSARRSFDLSRVVAGVRCRFNVLQSARGVGMVIRLLPGAIPRLAELNLHPDLAALAGREHGLVIVSGATGSGKSTTLAALVEEINVARAVHVLTVEQPIEYRFRPRRALIRQREVGRDTPSFEQALLDAMREDPDVLIVGEMREPEVMRLTLNASETGHLVFATMHAATPVEAIARLVAAFPAEAQRGVCAQLADVLVAVLCQRLVHKQPPGLRIPEVELLVASTAARAIIRSGEHFKLPSAMETGRDDGMWTLERYRTWLARKSDFASPSARPADDVAEEPPEREEVVEDAALPDADHESSDAPAVELRGDEGGEIDGLIEKLRATAPRGPRDRTKGT